MLIDKEGEVTVTFPFKDMDEGGSICTSQIATGLLKLLKERKADEESGYYLAVTELISIGQGQHCGKSHINFLVKFRCRCFIPQSGDVMIGTVERLSRTAVWLKCGPVRYIYLAEQFMSGYSYVEGEKPFFLSTDQSRIECGIPIRFKVLAARWRLVGGVMHGSILATINESSLGPVQSAGSDAEELESLCAD